MQNFGGKFYLKKIWLPSFFSYLPCALCLLPSKESYLLIYNSCLAITLSLVWFTLPGLGGLQVRAFIFSLESKLYASGVSIEIF